MKTRRIYINETAFDAFVLDAVPVTYTEFDYDHNMIEAVEEVNAEIDPRTLETVLPTVYRIETSDQDSGARYEYYCVVPFQGMTSEEFVQNLIDNDSEDIRHMTEDRAEEILRWARNDDYNNEIPESLTAAEMARIWNEIRGTSNITKRYEAMEDGEDMDWCRCFHGTTPDGTDCYAVIHEGKTAAVKIGSETVDYVTDPADVKRLASAACPNYSDYAGYTDEYIIATTLDRCGCRACPWRDMCDAMDDIG